MTSSTADLRYAEALACEIAAVLTAAPESIRFATSVTTRYDAAAETYVVRVRVGRAFYDLVMPAPGAHYGLFRRHTWIGGVGLTSAASPTDVATKLLDCIATDLERAA